MNWNSTVHLFVHDVAHLLYLVLDGLDECVLGVVLKSVF